MTTTVMERITRVDAKDGKNVFINFAVRDEFGATQFQFRLDETPFFPDEGWISCASLETHWASNPPEYRDPRTPDYTDCPYTLTGTCWHDGTSSWASEYWVPNFKRFGTEWVWRRLEEAHAERFHTNSKETAA